MSAECPAPANAPVNTYTLVTGEDHSTITPYATLAAAEEALAEKRHGAYCSIKIRATLDEAVNIIKGIRTRKRCLYLAAAQFAPSQSLEDRALGKGWAVSAHVVVTRGALLRFLKDAYEYKATRAMVELNLYQNCVFVGSTAL